MTGVPPLSLMKQAALAQDMPDEIWADGFNFWVSFPKTAMDPIGFRRIKYLKSCSLTEAAPKLLAALKSMTRAIECGSDILPTYYQALDVIAEAKGN